LHPFYDYNLKIENYMKLIHTVQELRTELNAQRLAGKKIGFVPTMGALHEGHASLVKLAVAENDVVVVSDFVNPTQFNDQNDLLKYPRTLEADCELLEKVGAHYVFAPSVEEIYPEPDTRQFSYAPLDTVMEGKFRPGHFNGVCQVVSKLFMMVEPHCAYFGEKDFQQLAIIREMVKQMNFPIRIVGCPIVRESDGLALSSRNARLSDVQRVQALNISKTLFASKEYAATHTVEETQAFVEQSIAASEGLELEYFEIVDGLTLQKIAGWDETDYAVGCITVFCGEVRLIDNIKFKG
jgi:pantoate--beta-alanine ligase